MNKTTELRNFPIWGWEVAPPSDQIEKGKNLISDPLFVCFIVFIWI